MENQNKQYEAGTHPDMAPPASEVGIYGWVYHNFMSSPMNIVLSIVAVYIIYLVIPPFLSWTLFDAQWTGSTREACEDAAGACWPFVNTWAKVIFYYQFPADQLWRINLPAGVLVISIAALVIPKAPFKGMITLFLLFIFPVISYFLFYGGSFGLSIVETPYWGGLFLTLVIAIVGIVTSLPIGIILALGRRSDMPVIKACSVGFIELWRGVPLITVLFMASVMFPLFMPEGVNFDKLIRALIGVSLFSAAYMAEVVRGGLQAIPKGQYEGAMALGLNFPKMMYFIIMPQALKLVIPGIVNTFIGLFKDTTLVLIIGLFDFLGAIQLAGTNPDWLGFNVEGYVFSAFIYWCFCFSMSRYSQHLEKKLHTGH